MPTLHWIGKDKVINHHRDVPYKVLEHGYGFDAAKGKTKQPTGSGNKVIHGDNLEALKSLLPEYEGKVKCIYIDPPYNTGNEGWVYNDNVNDPRIKKWLGDVVGKEGEDLSRHDKWLCMMYPRVVLLHKLLADDGLFLFSIDDNEVAGSRFLLDDIFGSSSYFNTIHWKARGTGGQVKDGAIASQFQYVLIYAKNKGLGRLRKLENENAGSEKWRDLRKAGGQWQRRFRPKQFYPFFYDPKTGSLALDTPQNTEAIEVLPKDASGVEGFWENGVDTARLRLANGEFRIGKARNGELKIQQLEVAQETVNVGNYVDIPSTQAISEMKALGIEFETPKPVKLIEHLIQLAADKDAIILDSFAGSGTTAHAVLNLNKQDKGTRKFILTEMMDYAESFTAERVKRVMQGYGTDKNKTDGTGGAFDYYPLGAPLFIGQEQLNEDVGVGRIREYIWYSESRAALEAPAATAKGKATKTNPYYLGMHERTAYYFVYEAKALTTLDHELLGTLPTKGERTVIYADNCLLPKKFLEQHGIVFKKIPRDISRF
jgi:adenine-specific DNA-methyltransferase